MNGSKSEPDADLVLRDQPRPHVARLTLNRPKARNAQNVDLLCALNDAVEATANDPAARVIVIAAAGPHFSSGHDIRESSGDLPPFVARTAERDTVGMWGGFRQPGAEGQMAHELELYLGFSERWRTLPKPTIAQVQGRVIAGGLLLVWPWDIIFASDDAVFVDNTIEMGISGVEMFAHPYEMGIRSAKEAVLTARAITAQDAWEAGHINRVVPRADLEPTVLDYAERVARAPDFALALAKQAINTSDDVQKRSEIVRLGFANHHLLHSHWVNENGYPADLSYFKASSVLNKGS